MNTLNAVLIVIPRPTHLDAVWTALYIMIVVAGVSMLVTGLPG